MDIKKINEDITHGNQKNDDYLDVKSLCDAVIEQLKRDVRFTGEGDKNPHSPPRESPPSGLSFFEDAVPESFCDLVEEWFQMPETQNAMFPVTKSSEKARKVIHYGYKYDYNSGGTKQKAPEFPYIIEIFLGIISRVSKKEGISDNLNQCIINRYLPGQGIGPHIDKLDYGDTIVCFTFLSGREMEFTSRDTKNKQPPYKVYTPRRSMYIMTGESRYEWNHQMRLRKKDGNIPREECFSVTFREVKLSE